MANTITRTTTTATHNLMLFHRTFLLSLVALFRNSTEEFCSSSERSSRSDRASPRAITCSMLLVMTCVTSFTYTFREILSLLLLYQETTLEEKIACKTLMWNSVARENQQHFADFNKKIRFSLRTVSHYTVCSRTEGRSRTCDCRTVTLSAEENSLINSPSFGPNSVRMAYGPQVLAFSWGKQTVM